LLYQGEVLVDVPLLNMPKESRWLLLRTRSGKMVDEALQHGSLGGIVKVLDSHQSKEEWYGPGPHPFHSADGIALAAQGEHRPLDGDYAMARLSKRPVLVLSQNCDIQTKQFIQVAPIFDAEGAPEHLERLRRGEILSAFWMAAHDLHLAEGYADLELIQAVHKSYIRRLLPTQHFRLASNRIRDLQRFLTRYFGRPNAYDVGADTAPLTGNYLCVACFYLDGVATSVPRNKGQEFEKCTRCGGRGWVLKGR
jgi:hypothetical protein